MPQPEGPPTHFAFLAAEWPEVNDAARRAERLVYADARASSFYARRALELAVDWMYRNDPALTLPYQDHLSALIHEPTFRNAVGAAVFNKAKIIKDLGNQAVHTTKPVRQFDALTAVRELFHVTFAELERMLVDAGVGTSADIVRAKQEASGLGLFIRSLVGMDREAAKQAFGVFLTGRAPSANQIEFVNLIVDHLTEHGVMDPARLYESPFTDINPRGPEGVFTEPQVDELVSVLKEIRQTAAA